jgi:hypothetical protein
VQDFFGDAHRLLALNLRFYFIEHHHDAATYRNSLEPAFWVRRKFCHIRFGERMLADRRFR